MNQNNQFDQRESEEIEKAESLAKHFAIKKISSFQFPLPLRLLGAGGVVSGSAMLCWYINALAHMNSVFHNVNGYMILAQLMLFGGIGIWVWGISEVISFKNFLTENFDQMVADGIIEKSIICRAVNEDVKEEDRQDSVEKDS